jgi:FG-GAP-like repeat/FG-GAP repeat
MASVCQNGENLPFGPSVASVGDVNGDGYADLAAGGAGDGSVVVYLGNANGLATAPATDVSGPYDASTPGPYFTPRVAGAGDVNGDGFGDLIVGGYDNSWGDFGGYYVYLGSANGLATTPATALSGFVPDGPAGSFFDSSVACAGDVNGDGYADVLAGACGSMSSACVYLGSAEGVVSTPSAMLTVDGTVEASKSAGDVDGDGYSDVALSYAGVNGAPGQTEVSVYLGGPAGLATQPAVSPGEPNASLDNFAFAFSFASAGDVDGDGYSDLVVGASNGTPNGAPDGTGSAYVYRGGPADLAATPSVALVGVQGENGNFGASVFGATD